MNDNDLWEIQVKWNHVRDRTFTTTENVFLPIDLLNSRAMQTIPLLLAEVEALRSIVKELVASNCMATNDEATEYCIFCGRFKWSGHEADCLITRAKELMKA